jgi:hypothetical protein
MAQRVTVRIYDSQIAGLFRGPGDVMVEARKAGRRGQAIARKLAPKRSYRLRDAHGHTVYPTNKYGTRIVIYNDAPHAGFVHDGTQGPITAHGISAKTGGQKRLRLKAGGKRGKKYGVLFRFEVAGQSGQPWLEEAAVALTSEYQ